MSSLMEELLSSAAELIIYMLAIGVFSGMLFIVTGAAL